MNSTSYSKIILLFIITFFVSCIPEDEFNDEEQFEKDVEIIQDYIQEKEISAFYIGTTGIFISYKHIDYNQRTYPSFNLNDDSVTYVNIGYKGYLTDGTVFDQSPADTTVEMPLERLIRGWQIGIPQMTAGDSATLYIPSYYGYGNYEVEGIPKNSVLLFDIYLESFENRIY